MLRSTFIHVPGITASVEQRLWQEGVDDWDGLLAYRGEIGSEAPLANVHAAIRASIASLEARDFRPFATGLGLREAWRAFHDFRDSCVYLDIETDGGQSGSSITTIGMYDGMNYTCLVKGNDLDTFPDAIAEFGMIVTFFGSGFDLPMLGKKFRGIRFDQIHIDLCPTLRRLGLRGGLKSVEKQLGIGRSEQTDGLSGMDAVRLWRKYTLLDDESALDRLIAYNREDVVNLERLAEHAYSGLWRQTRGSGEAIAR